ncbi:MAG: FMN-binding protein [Pseudomonadota bacterium]
MKRLWMITFLVGAAAISAALLAFIYYSSESDIKENERLVEICSVMNALKVICPINKAFLEKKFNDTVEIREVLGKKFYIEKDDGTIAFKIKGPGFWDMIEAVIAIESDLKTLRGVAIVSEKETPGLGGRLDEYETLERFKGASLFPKLIITTFKPTRPNEVEAITGATQTSKAFVNIINNAIKENLEALKLLQEEIISVGAGFKPAQE